MYSTETVIFLYAVITVLVLTILGLDRKLSSSREKDESALPQGLGYAQDAEHSFIAGRMLQKLLIYEDLYPTDFLCDIRSTPDTILIGVWNRWCCPPEEFLIRQHLPDGNELSLGEPLCVETMGLSNASGCTRIHFNLFTFRRTSDMPAGLRLITHDRPARGYYISITPRLHRNEQAFLCMPSDQDGD